MRHDENAATELAYLMKLVPAMQEAETVEETYRLLLSIATAGRNIGYERATLFAVDLRNGVIRGRFAAHRLEGRAKKSKSKFEEFAREVFDVYEKIDRSDATLKARSFSVPLGWKASALIKAANTGHPVLAQRELSEFMTDPFFDFFGAGSYIAVPIRVGKRVAAILAADTGRADVPTTVDDISLLYSLAQQASAAAQRIINLSNHKRRFRVLAKVQETLNNADTTDRLEDGIHHVLTMIVRALDAGGCLLKDLVRQKTFHIKPVSEYSADAEDVDIEIATCFDPILDRAAGRVETIWGDQHHPLVAGRPEADVAYFLAHPLVCGKDIAGAIAVYASTRNLPADHSGFKSEDRVLFELCAGLIAAKIEVHDKNERNRRVESFVEEISSNLAREREASWIGSRSVEYFERINDGLKKVRETLSKKTPYGKRFPKVVKLIDAMQSYSDEYRREVTRKEPAYTMCDFFELVRDVTDDWRSHIEGSGIDVTVKIPEHGPKLLVDDKKLSNAFAGILDATASTLRENDKVQIECNETEDRVQLCIADNGRGLSGDAISRLFIPFEEIDDGDERKRALTLAGEVLQRHHGEVMVRSSLGWKTILVIRFPVAANKDRRKASSDRRRRRERRAVARTAKAS